jgi:hypothetical protein
MRYIHSEETLEVPENGTCANYNPMCDPNERRSDSARTPDPTTGKDKSPRWRMQMRSGVLRLDSAAELLGDGKNEQLLTTS